MGINGAALRDTLRSPRLNGRVTFLSRDRAARPANTLGKPVHVSDHRGTSRVAGNRRAHSTEGVASDSGRHGSGRIRTSNDTQTVLIHSFASHGPILTGRSRFRGMHERATGCYCATRAIGERAERDFRLLGCF